MTVEEVRTRLRAKLEEAYGVDEASILMDRPPGGWGDLVTNASLHRELAAMESRVDLKFVALEARMDARFAAVEHRFVDIDHRFDRFEHKLLAQVDRRLRAQTWVTLTAIITSMGTLVALVKL